MGSKNGTATGLLILRIVLGGAFLYHGLAKQPFAADATVQMFMMWGLPAPGFMAFLAILLEVGGGAMLLLGVYVRPVALVLIAEMLVAMFKVHWSHGFSFMQIDGISDTGLVMGFPGWEVNLLYIAGFLALALTESHKLSLESLRRSG